MRCPSTWGAERGIRRQRLVLHLLPMKERSTVISHLSSSNLTIQVTASRAFREQVGVASLTLILNLTSLAAYRTSHALIMSTARPNATPWTAAIIGHKQRVGAAIACWNSRTVVRVIRAVRAGSELATSVVRKSTVERIVFRSASGEIRLRCKTCVTVTPKLWAMEGVNEV